MGKNLKGKELGLGLSQRKDGRYSARFVTFNGKRVEKYFAGYQDARRWLAEARLADEYGHGRGISPIMTVNEWFEFWIVYLKGKTVRPNTIRNHKERYYRNIKRYLGGMVLNDVRPMHCQAVLNGMADDYAGSSIQQCLNTMYGMFRDAADNSIIAANPVKKSVKVPKPVEKKIRFLTIDEQVAFLEEAKHTVYYPQYLFVLNTGVRAGEMIGLKWEDIDFDRKIISIKRTMEYRYTTGEWYIGPPKTKNAFREIPMTDECVGLLLDLKMKLKLGKKVEKEFKEFVFINRKGTPSKNSTYDSHIRKLTRNAGIENFSMHSLRHTFATRCIEAGMRPKTLQQILGHYSMNTTMNLYVHVTDEEKAKEMRKLEDYTAEWRDLQNSIGVI